MQAILTFLGTFLAKLFTDKVIGWIALKVVIVFLFVTIVPIILNNFLYDIIEIVMNFATGQTSGASSMTGSMSFTGFCAWLIQCFKISESLAVFVSALILRATLNMIPLVRL
jgi:hypothetical protein